MRENETVAELIVRIKATLAKYANPPITVKPGVPKDPNPKKARKASNKTKEAK